MTDTYGDGWNGAYYTWSDDNGEQLMTGTIEAGSSGQDDGLCIYDDQACYTLTLNDGSYPNEIGWSMVNGGSTYATCSAPGCAPATAQVWIARQPVARCADPRHPPRSGPSSPSKEAPKSPKPSF